MFRICHPYDFKGFYVYDEASEQFSGTLGLLFNEASSVVVQGMRTLMKNMSFVIQPSALFKIQPTPHNYHGCIDALQNNQSDLLYSLVEYPSTIENVTQREVVLDTALTIGSAYQKTETGEMSQVLSSFKSFSPLIWMLCLMTFCCLSLLLRLKNSLVRGRRDRYNAFYVASHMMRLNAISDVGGLRKMIFLLASLYSLVVVHYFSSLIKTELVAFREPQVFRSYQDIMDRKAQPLFVRGMTYDTFFSRQNAPTNRRRLWKYVESNFLPSDLYIDLDPLQFLLSGLAVVLEKQVVIFDSLLMPIIPHTGCPIAARNPEKCLQFVNNIEDSLSSVALSEEEAKRDTSRYIERYSKPNFKSMPGFNFFMSRDPDERPYLLGILRNRHSAPSVDTALTTSLARATQAGINLFLVKKSSEIDALGQYTQMFDLFGPKQRSRLYLIHECESGVIVQPDSDFHPLTLGNFRTLFILVTSLIPLLLFILLVEHLSSQIHRPV